MKILLTGAGGQVGTEVARRAPAGFEVVALPRAELDITNAAQVEAVCLAQQPALIVNAAAYTAVDQAEKEPELAGLINRDGPAHLARFGAAPLIHLSTDYVFNGREAAAWQEGDPADPLGTYGASKWAGEEQVRQVQPHHIILRVSWVFGAHGNNFVKTMMRLGREREELRIVADQEGCPTAAADIADVIYELAGRYRDQEHLEWGTYHYCGDPAATWHGFAQEIFAQTREYEELAVQSVHPIKTEEYPLPAPRPANSVLNCEKIERTFGIRPRSWKQSLKDVVKELCSD